MFVEINGCNNCPLNRNNNDGHASMEFCAHPSAPEGYGKLIDVPQFSKRMPWCPLEKEPYCIRIHKDEYIRNRS